MGFGISDAGTHLILMVTAIQPHESPVGILARDDEGVLFVGLFYVQAKKDLRISGPAFGGQDFSVFEGEIIGQLLRDGVIGLNLHIGDGISHAAESVDSSSEGITQLLVAGSTINEVVAADEATASFEIFQQMALDSFADLVIHRQLADVGIDENDGRDDGGFAGMK
jgi:hypothetical protein